MCRWLLGWWLWAGLLECLWAKPAVSVPVNPSVPVRFLQIESIASSALKPPVDTPLTVWRVHQLPDEWIYSHPQYSGTVWYRFSMQWSGGVPEDAWALWLPKVAMNAELWINGRMVGRRGQMDGDRVSRFWYTPLMFDIPENVWQSGDNVIHLRVRARRPLQNGGLAPISLGPVAAVQSLHSRSLWFQNYLVALCGAFVVSLGLFFLVLWVRQTLNRQYLYFGAASIALGLSVSNLFINTPPLPDAQWERLVHLLQLWGALLLSLFPLGFARASWPTAERAVLLMGVSSTLVMLVLPESKWLPIWVGVMSLAISLDAVALSWMLYYIRRERRLRDPIFLGIAGLVMLVLGIHDMMLRVGWLPFDRPYGYPFMVPVLLGVTLVITLWSGAAYVWRNRELVMKEL